MLVLPSVANADAGPKPSIRIEAVNMPDMECYMDLLVEVDNRSETEPDLLKDDYDQGMISILSSYSEGNWSAAVVNREYIIFDGIKCKVEDGNCTKSFGYMPPDRFKIIVVSEDGQIVTSNVIERESFDSIIDFDYKTGEASERPILPGFILKFLITLVATLLIEGLLFLVFKFGFKKYWGWVLGINVITQIALYAAIILGTSAAGVFLGILAYIFAEFLIFTGETIAYAFILKSKPIGLRITYAISANLLSMVIGAFLFAIFI